MTTLVVSSLWHVCLMISCIGSQLSYFVSSVLQVIGVGGGPRINFVLLVLTEKARALNWTSLGITRTGLEEMTKAYKKDTYG